MDDDRSSAAYLVIAIAFLLTGDDFYHSCKSGTFVLCSTYTIFSLFFGKDPILQDGQSFPKEVFTSLILKAKTTQSKDNSGILSSGSGTYQSERKRPLTCQPQPEQRQRLLQLLP